LLQDQATLAHASWKANGKISGAEPSEEGFPGWRRTLASERQIGGAPFGRQRKRGKRKGKPSARRGCGPGLNARVKTPNEIPSRTKIGPKSNP
jgi:hypothetical protein